MIIDKTNAEHYIWGEGCEGWHLLKSDALSVIQERVPAGKSEKHHLHHTSRQFFYILKGNAVIEVNGILHELSEGQSIEVSQEVPHQFMNQSENDIEFIVISMPKSHGDKVEL
jgi:mannose-6-phosphate isomerase-like protein (cupin superfamily)